MSKTAPDEIKDVLRFLGREELDSRGQVKDRHLGQVLIYCQMWQKGSMTELIDRLCIRLGISSRYVKENYVQPLATEKVLDVIRMGHDLTWRWVGVPKKSNTPFMDYAKEREKEKQLEKEGKTKK